MLYERPASKRPWSELGLGRRLWLGLALWLALGASATACARESVEVSKGDRIEVDEAEVTETVVESPSTPAAAPTAPTEVPAEPDWLEGHSVGTCFNQVGEEPGAPLDCAGPHEYEIFAVFDAPAGDAPYPGDVDTTVSREFALCDPALATFGGDETSRLPLRTSIWEPSKQQWIEGARLTACAVQSVLAELPMMVGTAAGGTLDSAEGIVARATVDGQRDFFFSFEGSALHPLTQGGFDIANTSPHAFGSAFLFSAPRQGGDASRASAYAFDYATGAITELATGAPAGAEVASPHFVRDPAGYVFASRETPVDDWDIYRSTTDGDREPLTENDVDDRWPTLTPDGKQIVFHSEGDIWIMNIDGSDKRRLTDDPAGDYESAVSPDGAKIAFVSNRSGDDEVWLMNLDGSDQVNLTNHPAAEAWPFWSADGTVIYFQTDRLGANATIMMMETDGSNQSYYSYELLTNAALLPAEVTARFIAELPRLDE